MEKTSTKALASWGARGSQKRQRLSGAAQQQCLVRTQVHMYPSYVPKQWMKNYRGTFEMVIGLGLKMRLVLRHYVISYYRRLIPNQCLCRNTIRNASSSHVQ
jgi:hypothetical protein